MEQIGTDIRNIITKDRFAGNRKNFKKSFRNLTTDLNYTKDP